MPFLMVYCLFSKIKAFKLLKIILFIDVDFGHINTFSKNQSITNLSHIIHCFLRITHYMVCGRTIKSIYTESIKNKSKLKKAFPVQNFL